VTKANLTEGAYLIVFGLFKKVVLADNMATLVNHIFNSPLDSLSGGEILLGLYAFAFQIYGDFSGYSSIAQGLAKMLGFELMWNFRMPYFSVSPSDFWKRWHISLSSWIRDYLYIPLGGNRYGTARTARNLCVTMLLAGLWHGAAWTYVIWGAFHGALMVVYRAFAWLGGDDGQGATGTGLGSKGLRLLRTIFFFHLVCISWLFFRANSMEQAWDMLAILSSTWLSSSFLWYGAALFAFFVAPFVLYELWLEKRGDQLALLQAPWPVQAACYSYVSVLALVFVPIAPQVFIYFQF
jgi:D-alanyl-lipoteichoic acid acyltransferase DltB (MBOAT superfamily)